MQSLVFVNSAYIADPTDVTGIHSEVRMDVCNTNFTVVEVVDLGKRTLSDAIYHSLSASFFSTHAAVIEEQGVVTSFAEPNNVSPTTVAIGKLIATDLGIRLYLATSDKFIPDELTAGATLITPGQYRLV